MGFALSDTCHKGIYIRKMFHQSEEGRSLIGRWCGWVGKTDKTHDRD